MRYFIYSQSCASLTLRATSLIHRPKHHGFQLNKHQGFKPSKNGLQGLKNRFAQDLLEGHGAIAMKHKTPRKYFIVLH